MTNKRNVLYKLSTKENIRCLAAAKRRFYRNLVGHLSI